MNIESQAPFRRPPADAGSYPAQLRGSLPRWLRGSVVRTCPAVFRTPAWETRHWFDALGALFAFRIEEQPRLDWRLLDCEMARLAGQGLSTRGSFGTPMRRPLWKRLSQPVPLLTDNTNVNVQPFGSDLVAMTETQHQALVDPGSLSVSGWIRYQDELGPGVVMSAHPLYDVERGLVVNIAKQYGRRSSCNLYHHAPGQYRRQISGCWQTAELPYIHTFGLTRHHAVIIAHPLLVKPFRMLFSDLPFAEHFRWQPERGTRLVVLDRNGGKPRIAETDAFFVFHVANAFEAGQDIVLDVLAYPDAGIVTQLRIDRLAEDRPKAPDYVRLRISPTAGVQVERLLSPGFEFPTINYRRTAGRPHRFCWGADPWLPGGASAIFKLDAEVGTTKRASFADWIVGEPLFAPAPQATGEDEGVLLAVGSHRSREASALFVIDAATLDTRATVEAPVSLPLGFHGTFLAASEAGRSS